MRQKKSCFLKWHKILPQKQYKCHVVRSMSFTRGLILMKYISYWIRLWKKRKSNRRLHRILEKITNKMSPINIEMTGLLQNFLRLHTATHKNLHVAFDISIKNFASKKWSSRILYSQFRLTSRQYIHMMFYDTYIQ